MPFRQRAGCLPTDHEMKKMLPEGVKTALKRDLCKMYRGRKFGPKKIQDAQNEGRFFVRMPLNAPRRIIRRGALFFGRQNIVARRVKNARIPCKIRERRRSGNRREKALFRPLRTNVFARRPGGGKNGASGAGSKWERIVYEKTPFSHTPHGFAPFFCLTSRAYYDNM